MHARMQGADIQVVYLEFIKRVEKVRNFRSCFTLRLYGFFSVRLMKLSGHLLGNSCSIG